MDEAPIPPKKPSGTEITSAHGHETIRKIHALLILSDQARAPVTPGITASKRAPIVTIGV